MTKLENSVQFESLGTRWVVETAMTVTALTLKRIKDRLERFDLTYSRFRSDSLVSSMAKSAGVYDFPNDFPALFKFYEQLYGATGGQVNPLVGQLLEEAGYDAGYSFAPSALRQVPGLNSVEWDGASQLTTKIPIVLDVGAAGKGYAVDLISDVLARSGYSSHVIDAGGDIVVRGDDMRTAVGLENPFDTSKVIGSVNVRNESICASAGNRRTWGEYHHIMNPKTLLPIDDIIATWAIADDAMTADGVATALFFVQDPTDELKDFLFSYVRLHKDGSVEKSNNFNGDIFS